MAEYISLIIAQVITLSVTAVFSYVVGKTKKSNEQWKNEMTALKQAIITILRTQLVDDYKMYVQDGEPLTVERKREITEGYEAYSKLGGNGTGKHMYEAICELDIHVLR